MVSPAQWSWVDLPPELTASIFSRLTAEEILMSAQFVCKAWLQVSKDPLFWKTIDIGEFRDEINRLVIDRSCGQAVEVTMQFGADDDLLEYLCDRSSQIKCLRLVDCDDSVTYGVTAEGMMKAVEKLPLLEDLDLTLTWWHTADNITTIGQKCPRLKAFKQNTVAGAWMGFVPDDEDLNNEEAVAVGKYMPGLKTLQLIGNFMSNTGLGAILEGCPHLESLDIRKCFNISLKGEVWKRCLERVKHLRLPGDPLDDVHHMWYTDGDGISDYIDDYQR